MRRHVKRLSVPFAMLALLISVSSALAGGGSFYQPLGHNNPYTGSNNWQTAGPGYLAGYYNAPYDYTASGEYLYWSQDAINWIRANTQDNRYQPSFVFHAFLYNNPNQCAFGTYLSSWSDLPSRYVYKKSTCGGDENELREMVGTPWDLQPWQYYNAQARYYDATDPSYKWEINIDNYWVDTGYFMAGVIKDNMQKFCYQWDYIGNC
jgi:hypothetical protein